MNFDPAWIGIALVAIGLVASWVKNGRNQSERFGKIEKAIEQCYENNQTTNERISRTELRLETALNEYRHEINDKINTIIELLTRHLNQKGKD